MRTTTLGIAFALASASGALAQPWTRTFDAASVTTARATADGGFIAAGDVGGAWLLRADADGLPTWQRSFATIEPWWIDDVAPTPDGGFVASAHVTDETVHVARLDGSGNVLWAQAQRAVAGPATALVALSDGGALLVGPSPTWYWMLDGSGATVRLDRIDAAPAFFAAVESVAASPAGGALLASRYGSDGVWLVRLDAAGNVVRQLTLDGDYGMYDSVRRVVVAATADGGFLVALWVAPFEGSRHALHVARLDASLDVVWGRRIDVDLGFRVASLCELADGAIALSGLVQPITEIGAYSWPTSATSVVVLEPTGEVRWAAGHRLAVWQSQITPMPDGGSLLWTAPIVRRLDASGRAGDTCDGAIDLPPFVASSWVVVATPTAAVAQSLVSDVVAGATTATDTAVTMGQLGDAHEPDDACGMALEALAEGTSARDFCDDSEDWYELFACEGSVVDVATSGLGPLADTVVEVFASDCVSLLASDDDGGGGRASWLSWVAPADAVYHVRIRQADGTSGLDRGYDLTLARLGFGCGTWIREYQHATAAVFPTPQALASRDDGGFVLAGSWVDLDGRSVALATGLGSSGEVLWTDSPAHPWSWPTGDAFSAALAPASGGALVAGTVANGPVVRALDGSGALQWERAYAVPGRPSVFGRMIALRGGGYAVAGGIRNGVGLNPWIVRLDASGLVAWSREIPAPYGVAGADLVETADGGLLIASPQTSPAGLVLTRLGPDGDPLWQRRHSFITDGWLAAATRTVDGTIVVAAGDTLLRLDDDGRLLSSRQLGGISAWVRAEDLVATEDGGVVVAGSKNLSAVSSDPLLVRLDTSGDVEWQRVAPSLGAAFMAVTRSPEGGFVAAATSRNGTSSEGLRMIKLDGAGTMRGACVVEDAGIAVSSGRRDVEELTPAATSVVVDVVASVAVPTQARLTTSFACAGGRPGVVVEDCFDGVDDDGDGRVDCADDSCATADVDEDGAFDCVDCAPFEDGAREVPGEVEDLRVVKVVPDGFMVHLTWSDSVVLAGGEGTVFDVTSGSIATLHASGWPSPVTCTGNDVAELDRYDLRVGVTECWWLVRAENACGTGSWGAGALPEPDCP